MTSKRNIDRRLDELEGDGSDDTNRIKVYDTATRPENQLV